jgi:hypothetical protein
MVGLKHQLLLLPIFKQLDVERKTELVGFNEYFYLTKICNSMIR